MIPTTITTGYQTATTAGPLTPSTGISIASMSGDAEIQINISNLTGKARLQIEDTVDAFAHAEAIAVFDVQGNFSPSAPLTLSVPASQLADLRIGATGAAIRANLIAIDGTGATITAEALILN